MWTEAGYGPLRCEWAGTVAEICKYILPSAPQQTHHAQTFCIWSVVFAMGGLRPLIVGMPQARASL